MKNIDEIVDQFIQKLDLNGIGIEAYSGIDWIDRILKRLPTKYPPSFMSLISRYIFDDFEVDKLWFFANRGDQGYEELSQAIFRDSIIFEVTSSKGYLHFARPADGSYDPVCFDIRNRKNKEFPVVRLDHESILQFERINIVESLYPSLLDVILNYVNR
jgi:hypothetical protein